MKKIFFSFLFAGLFFSAYGQKSNDKSMAKYAKNTKTAKPPVALADPKYMDMGRQIQKLFEDGKFDEWGSHFADNAVFLWSAGDSLAGRQAIVDYWKARRTNDIETIKFSNDIWLPVQINQPQQGPDMPGVWLLSWYQVYVKYKNGKQLTFWVHHDHHFNDNNKIDRSIQYVDRAPIREALSAK